MPYEMILRLFDEGTYVWIDSECKVLSGRTGKEVFTYSGDRSNIQYVRLYNTENGKKYYRAIARHHVSWIIGSRADIPEGWQVHHRDTDQTNDRYKNLICCHPNDHRKLHEEKEELDSIPF